ncbi:hypothetical protein DFJ58DRAFT_730093 [Suillus subalutaceus]|uniref:uncharacterized protein n=1 Tax=Suillus subalutaceus TaxID=48586 RepID=UPI001B85D815|nr:uncharacterized protein DFJ58DRAFT_730093 [Suillus subalutaceus]KAG1847680.1 hypothetical protein DFJ58DRAFT_730093 [Suillus subalutaceus]
MTTKPHRQRPAAEKATEKKPKQRKTQVSATGKHGHGNHTPDSGPVPKKRQVAKPHAESDSDIDGNEGCINTVKHKKGLAGKEKEQRSGSSQQAIDNVFLMDEPIEEISDFQPSCNDSEEDSEEEEEIEDNLDEPKSLSAEKTKTQSARDHKRANEADIQVVGSDEEPDVIMLSDDHSDVEEDGPDAHADYSGRPRLVWTETGKLKLMDQDINTRRMVQRAILEAKVHMTFVNGYPELTEKSLFTRNALLTAARACGVSPIQDRLKTDDSYVTALATLIEARVPLFRTELKDNACAQVTAYYHLGPDCVDTAKALLVNHIYHYEQHFNEKNDPIPQPKKPYFTDILPYLMKGCYFNGLKSVSMKFSDRFKEIANNKAQWPEVTIPMVVLTSTSVYAALFWKANGSPSKFNFTGNLFSEVYFFHVKFLEDMKVTAPRKFHKMMADIFEAIQKLCTNSSAALVGSHESAMAFLDIDGMDDEE